jgi:Putative DnaT-like ssDNA binding protein
MDPLDATPGGVTANSYCTVAEASDILYARLGEEAWFAEGWPTVRRAAALMWATQLLDSLMIWRGTPTTTTQALAWPQTGQVDSLGRAIDPQVVPPVIKTATAYYALALMQESMQGGGITPAPASPIRRRKIGALEIEYQQSTTVTRAASSVLPAEVQALLQPFGRGQGSFMVPLVRG